MTQDKKATMQNKASQKPPRPQKVKGAFDGLAGIFIFAIGLGAVAAVSYLGYVRFFQDGAGIERPGALSASALETSTIRTGRMYDDAPLETQSSLLQRDIEGNWQSVSDEKLVFASFGRDRFQILFAESRNDFMRRYSAGRYSYDEKTGLLTMRPDRDETLGFKMPDMQIRTLTLREFSVRVIRDERNGALVWLPPDGEETLRGRLHPLFFMLQRMDSFIGWLPA